MKAAGMIFLSRAKPGWSESANGERVLVLRAVDRLNSAQAEAWTLFWAGPAANEFMAEHGAKLAPGRALWAEVERIRTHRCGAFVELQARVISLWPVQVEAMETEGGAV